MGSQAQAFSVVEAIQEMETISNLATDNLANNAVLTPPINTPSAAVSTKSKFDPTRDQSTVVNIVKNTFQKIHHYIKSFYQNANLVIDERQLSKIKTIMGLTDQAVKKLDRCTGLFYQHQNNINELEEYRELQHSYQKMLDQSGHKVRINSDIKLLESKLDSGDESARSIDDFSLDINDIKKDKDYELLLIRRENGAHFFNPHLLHDLKMICNFEIVWNERSQIQSFDTAWQAWQDRVFRAYGRTILKALGHRLNLFWHEAHKVHDHILVTLVSKALLALMMSTYEHQYTENVVQNKSSADYFRDFQFFLRNALQTNVYQQYLTYAANTRHEWILQLIDLLHVICRTIYLNLQLSADSVKTISGWLKEAYEGRHRHLRKTNTALDSFKLSNKLADDYHLFTNFLNGWCDNSFMKFLKTFQQPLPSFDSILQGNLPHQLFTICLPNKRYNVIRQPSPIKQQYIHKATINEEFRDFILYSAQKKDKSSHLLINLQNINDWRTQARCQALNDLQKRPDLEEALQVVSFALDNDFYQQSNLHAHSHHASAFKKEFKHRLLSSKDGYFFPQTIVRSELEEFIDNTFDVLHRLFFHHKNVLSKDNRIVFIDLFHLFLELKCIEWLQPDSLSFSCKDGIDAGEVNSVALFVLLNLLNNQSINSHELEYITAMLYGPSLLIRARCVEEVVFGRMINLIKMVENVCLEFGAENFAKLLHGSCMYIFKTPVLHATLLYK